MLQVENDVTLSLNDIWVVEKFGETLLPNNGRPTIEFNPSKHRVSGNDGCNSFTGNIEHLDKTNLVLQPPFAATRRYCLQNTTPDGFYDALEQIVAYHLIDLHLTLLDASGKVLMVLKKVD